MQALNEELSAGHREVTVTAERTSAEVSKAAKTASEHAAIARDRIARLERGEDFAGGTTKVDPRRIATMPA